MNELETKLGRVREYCRENGFDGMHFQTRANFAWLSCGGNATVVRSEEGAAAEFVVLADREYMVASEIERYRIVDEELPAGSRFELVSYPWGEDHRARALGKLCGRLRIASDTGDCGFEELKADVAALRFSLTPEEIDRVRSHAAETARDFEAICRGLEPGTTEAEASARIAAAAMARGADAPVVLIAFDDRFVHYRHPRPTANTLKRRALVAGCIERGGLIVSLSRVVNFGPVEQEYLDRYRACQRVNAAAIAATAEGARGSALFAVIAAAYRDAGYPDEWRFHHQGGALGYACRDYVVDSTCAQEVRDNQLFSWNPTIRGTKVEDTILLSGGVRVNLTAEGSWPYGAVSTGSVSIPCPEILVK